MGCYRFSVLMVCLGVWCVQVLGRGALSQHDTNGGQATGGGRVTSGGYRYNYVMGRLFDEMNSAMSHIVSNQNSNKRTPNVLLYKIKKILLSKNSTLKNGAKTNNSNVRDSARTTDAIGVFRNIFKKVAGGIDQLYLTRKMEDFTRIEREEKKKLQREAEMKKAEKPRNPTNVKHPVNKISGGPKKPLQGVDVPTAKESNKPILQRLKELDVRRKHEYIYYEGDGEGSGSESRKSGNDLKKLLHQDDTELGSGEGEGSGQSDDEDTESGSGGSVGKVSRVPATSGGKKVVGGGQVVEGKDYGKVVQHVARAMRDRKA